MKTISVKLRDNVAEETDALAEAMNENRNSYINRAIAAYNAQQKRALLARRFARESALVAEESMKVLKEFEALDDKAI